MRRCRPPPARRVSAYAEELARRLESGHPELLLHRMAKALRLGKVFLDWSQNVSTKTTAAPYTLRARGTPAVSAPVTWDEVADCTGPESLSFTPAQMLDRIGRHGDLFAPLTDPAEARELPPG
jgi:bifunctional non-homologous end joining protein LigD